MSAQERSFLVSIFASNHEIKSMWLDLVIVMSSVVGGFVCGRIYVAVGGYTVPMNEKELDELDDTGPKMPSRDKVNEVAERLKVHAESMSASVDAHQSKMQAANNSLVENDQVSAEDVLSVVNELIEANKTMQRQLNDAQNRIHEQSMELQSAELRAQTDSLTRIPNRRAFDSAMADHVAKGSSKLSTLVLLDVDHFKKFNDHYGHVAGDEVLRVVAGLIHSRLNQYGLVSRYGGEEFAIILDGKSENEAIQLVEQTRIAISNRETEFENKRLRVTASLGIAQFDGNESIEQWIQRADAGLYASKAAGRNCTHWMDDRNAILITKSGQSIETNGTATSDSTTESSILDSFGMTESPEAQEIPECFAPLPNQAALSEEFASSRNGLPSDVEIRVMAIRNHDSMNEASINSLLPVVRSTLRSVDRIGYANASTLLICMQGVNEEIARERGTQICRSAATIGMATGGGCERPVSVGIASAGSDDDLNTAVQRAIALANEATDNENAPVRVEPLQALSV